jgi:uncharacterized membrane-anchored protein
MQIIILIAMLVMANLPLYFGTEIKVKTTPVDPRSMFRGNYVKLNYEFNRISIDKNHPFYNKHLNKGEKIYISLEKTKQNLYIYKDLSLEPFQDKLYLQGRVKYYYFKGTRIFIKIANIDSFFAPKEKALAIEKILKQDAIAVLMVMKNGKVRIKSIQRDSKSKI